MMLNQHLEPLVGDWLESDIAAIRKPGTCGGEVERTTQCVHLSSAKIVDLGKRQTGLLRIVPAADGEVPLDR